MKQRPNFSIYKIMDDIAFSDDGVIPALTLQHHIRKLYPYVDDSKIKLFVTLVDLDGDKRIEIQELFKFFNELYEGQIQFHSVMEKLSQIIYSTNENVDSFLKVHKI